jgi:hypothetical protein
MRRWTKVAVASGALGAMMVLGAGPAFADAGAPGSTYPEQPGTNVAGGCAAVVANSGTGIANRSPTALDIALGLVLDACLGG